MTLRRTPILFRSIIIGGAFAVAACNSGPGYHTATVATALPFELRDTAGSFKATIRRQVANDSDRAMIERAEATYPSRDAVVAALKAMPHWKDPAPNEPLLWWRSDFDGIRIPYAITGSAIRYYLELIQLFRQGQFREAHTIAQLNSKFEYFATLYRTPVFEHDGQVYRNVVVVHMKLTWSNYCGPLCALSFSKERFVLLDHAGGIVAVFGDGPVPLLVS